MCIINHSDNYFTISTWNIHGISDKSFDEDFIARLNKSDIFILTETWCENIQNISSDFDMFCIPAVKKKTKTGRKSGGIIFLYREKLFENRITLVKKCNNYIWIKVDRHVFNTDRDIYLCGAYINPDDSPYFDEDVFENLEYDIDHFSNIGHIIIAGDLNARVGKYDDFVNTEGNKFIDDKTEYSLKTKPRNSFDSILNSNGKNCLNLCKTYNLRILNGRIKGDSLGKPTFHSKNGTSVVDYIITSQDMFSSVETFTVHQPTHLSDHSCITAKIKVNTQNIKQENSSTVFSSKLNKLKPQFCWDAVKKEYFENMFETVVIARKITQFRNNEYMQTQENIDMAVKDVSEIFITAAKHSLTMKKVKHTRKKQQMKKWFDKDCHSQRVKLRNASNQKHRNPENVLLRENYHKILKNYKTTICQKKEDYQNQKIRNLENEKNSKEFWKILKSKDDLISSPEVPPVSEDQWLSHFQKLHSDIPFEYKNKVILDKLKNKEENIKDSLNFLDDTITEKEITPLVNKLKNNKSPGQDQIRNEMIKAAFPYLKNEILKLFNIVLCSGFFPTKWSESLLTPIHKSGPKKDPGNYRGICVSSCLGKLFCSILNTRLLNHIQENNLLHPSQIGFIPGNRTSDHIFTLKTLIDKYTLNTNKGKIYACFVDFKKAFDSIWHEGLLYKLLENNIGGKIFDLIKSLYHKTQVSIKHGTEKTKPFQYCRGVRQGCILSPLLFNLYINELPTSLDNSNDLNPFFLPNGQKLNCLLYADDLILLSQSKDGLQKSVNKLSQFCTTWNMDVNLKKTKTITFQKKSRKNCTTDIFLNNFKLENVNEYTYLGTKITASGNFTLAQEIYREKAIHAIFTIKKHLNFNKLPVSIANKIFTSMIEPILTYSSEIWGAYCKHDLNTWEKNPIEKAHMKFCKTFLGVNNKTTNAACRAEMGKQLIKLNIDKRIFKYFLHLNKLPDSSIAKQSLIMSETLHQNGISSYITKIYKLLETIDIDNIENLTSFLEDSLKLVNKKLELMYETSWKNKFINSKKTEFLRLFKSKSLPEEYLNNIKNPAYRVAIAKLRLSNHPLMIESGRYFQPKLERNQRKCPYCLNNSVEDEAHFLFDCKLYNKRRELFYSNISENLNVDILTLSREESVAYLFTSNDPKIQFLLSQYIFDNFNSRKNTIL